MSWYAIYTKPRHEKTVEASLIDKQIETYLPVIKRVRQWKDRKKKVEMPLFNGYLFVNIDYKNRFDVLETSGVVKIINFSGTPAVVPDWQIESLRQMLNFPETLQIEQYIKPGEIVEIVEGPMRGMSGTVITKRGAHRLVLTIDGIFQTISVQIDESSVKRIKQKETQ